MEIIKLTNWIYVKSKSIKNNNKITFPVYVKYKLIMKNENNKITSPTDMKTKNK